MGVLLSSKQLLDILSLHVCSKLQASDLHALSQTCTVLRKLVLEELPEATWEAVAANELPSCHPLLKLAGFEVKTHLERIARAKQTMPDAASLSASTVCLAVLSLPQLRISACWPSWILCVLDHSDSLQSKGRQCRLQVQYSSRS